MRLIGATERAVRSLADSRGESMAALARRLGVTPQAIAKRIRRRAVTTETIRVMAEAFGLSPGEFRRKIVAEYRSAAKAGILLPPPMVLDRQRAITPA